MVLELEWSSFLGLRFTAASGTLEFYLVMNFDAIVINGCFGRGNLLSGFIKLGGNILDIICLPDKGRKTSVHTWFVLGVDATAFVVFSSSPKLSRI